MRGAEGPGATAGWAELIRGAPLGILILCALLFFLGSGLVLGGVYLAIARGDTGWVAWAMALLVGPVALYLALHLLRRTSWAWLAMVALLGLLLCSSVVRLLASPESPLSIAAELLAEILCLVYLVRPPVRAAFGWRRASPLS